MCSGALHTAWQTKLTHESDTKRQIQNEEEKSTYIYARTCMQIEGRIKEHSDDSAPADAVGAHTRSSNTIARKRANTTGLSDDVSAWPLCADTVREQAWLSSAREDMEGLQESLAENALLREDLETRLQEQEEISALASACCGLWCCLCLCTWVCFRQCVCNSSADACSST